MAQMVEEREPGVYVRSNRPEHELDFLWDRERRKEAEHDRFHLGFFAAGAVVGSLITFAGCFIFFTGGKLVPVPISDKPVIEERVVTPKDVQTDTTKTVTETTAGQNTAAQTEQVAPKVEEKPGFSLPFFSSKPKEAETVNTQPAQVDSKARFYEVQSGDTLGRIAIKFYDSSSPDMVEKIQRANKMTDADTLSLGERLVIPPKTY